MARRTSGGAGMARRPRPSRWHLFLTAAVVAGAVGLYLYPQWRQRRRAPAPVAVVATPAEAPALAVDPAALADRVYARAEGFLAEMGVWPELIRKARAAELGRGGNPVDRIAVRVPADLPLTELNLYLTRFVQGLGGQVLGAIERQAGRQVELRCGLDQTETTLFALERDPQLTRRAGAIAIVLQEFGGQAGDQYLERCCRLPQGLSLAVSAADDDAAARIAAQAHGCGHQLLLQVPAASGRTGGPDEISPAQDSQTIRRLLRTALRRLPGAEGLSWPLDSRSAADPRLLEEVLDEARRQSLLVLDASIPPSAGAGGVAASKQVRLVTSDLLIDPVDDPAQIEKNLWELAKLAVAQGQAVGLGHGREQTLLALEAVLPRLETRGYRFLSLAQLGR